MNIVEALTAAGYKDWSWFGDPEVQDESALDQIKWNGVAPSIRWQDLQDAVAVKVQEDSRTSKYQEELSKGFDTGLGYRLSFGDRSRADFSGLVTLLREAEELSLAPKDVNFLDKDNQPRSLSLEQFRALIVQYGLHYMQARLA